MPATGIIFLVTDRADLETDGTANLAGFLRSLGYQVDVSPSPGNASEFRGLLSADEIAQLEASDLVIVHRATGSGSFIGEEGAIQTQWNSLEVPLLMGSAYLARSTHWSWTAGAQTRSTTVDLTFADSNHPIVAGMGTDLFTEARDVDHLTTLDVGNGTLVATANEGVVVAVWDQAGLFRNEGTQSHPQRRVFFPIMRYHEADATAGIFGDYSANGLRILANAVEYAMTGQVSSVPAQVRIVDLTISSEGFGLSIDTEPGRSYRVEVKDALDDPQWETLTTLEGDGTRQSATDSVTEAQRLTLRTSLVAAIGEPATTVLMEAMPPIDYDNLASKADIEVLRAEMNARFVALSAELRGEMAELRSDLRAEMATLGGDLRTEMATLRGEMASQTRIIVGAHIASMLGFAGLILGFG